MWQVLLRPVTARGGRAEASTGLPSHEHASPDACGLADSLLPFYNSPYHAGTFVAAASRDAYRSYLQSFDDEYAADIADEAPTATYVTSSGAGVSGSDAGLNANGTSISGDDTSDGYGNPGGSSDDGTGGQGGGDDGGGQMAVAQMPS